jgi:hypothetical protein
VLEILASAFEDQLSPARFKKNVLQQTYTLCGQEASFGEWNHVS